MKNMSNCKICDAKIHVNQIDSDIFCQWCKDALKFSIYRLHGVREEKEMTLSESDIINYSEWLQGQEYEYLENNEGKLLQDWMKQRQSEKKYSEKSFREKAEDDFKAQFKRDLRELNSLENIETAYHKEEQNFIDSTKKPAFKVGDWAWHSGDSKAYLCVEKNPIEFTYESMINHVNKTPHLYTRLATEKEIETTLIEEAKRRGIKHGVTIKRGNDWSNVVLSGKMKYKNYGINFSILEMDGQSIWRSDENKWAEIVEEEKLTTDTYKYGAEMTWQTPKEFLLKIGFIKEYGLTTTGDFQKDLTSFLNKYAK